MTEEEIEIVAEELAKIGGVSWYPGREKGTLMRVVSDRYRDRARIAIEALDRYRASKAAVVQDNSEPHRPGDRRAYPCRVVEIEGSRAYLAPILRACTDWVSIEHLTPQTSVQPFPARDTN